MESALLQTDTEGFFINTLEKENIQDAFIPIVDGLISNYKIAFKDKLYSVYLRGSVAKGNAKPGFSDVDTFSIIQGSIEDEEKNILKVNNDFLLSKFNFISRLDCQCLSYYDVFNSQLSIKHQFRIKYLSLCVFGTDISSQIKKFRPSKEIIEHLPELEKRINNIKNKFVSEIPSPEVKKICISIMKSIVRAGFELCIERENCYTNELNQCITIFSKYYPNQTKKMQSALSLACFPTDNKDTIIRILDEIGSWLMDIYEKQKIL